MRVDPLQGDARPQRDGLPPSEQRGRRPRRVRLERQLHLREGDALRGRLRPRRAERHLPAGQQVGQAGRVDELRGK